MSPYAQLTAGEAALLIRQEQTIGFGGFLSAGAPCSIAGAIGDRAAAERAAGREFRIGYIGVATGASMDGVLAEAICLRTPYQSSPELREQINAGACRYFDMHLSHVTQALRYGFLGPMHWAIVQAADVSADGEILLTSSVGGAPTYCARADRVLIELNHRHPPSLLGMHDVYEPADPPQRREIPIYKASDRIGSPVVRVDPAKIAGVVESDLRDEGAAFSPLTPVTESIGRNVAGFIAGELAAGRLPRSFLPVQCGVGDVGNAALGVLAGHPGVPPFEMYTEIIQDSVIDLMEAGRVTFASCCALALSPGALQKVYGHLEYFRPRLLLRPHEITNHPEVVRRLGVISINTALEADIYGNVNSTHVLGTQMMNGIGGSADFTRNAYLPIFICPSTARGGAISTIVPMVTHVDHSEHSVQVIATEWGVADLRGLPPRERATAIIESCAHPEYRDDLRDYVRLAEAGHTGHTLRTAFSFHERFATTGDMRTAVLR